MRKASLLLALRTRAFAALPSVPGRSLMDFITYRSRYFLTRRILRRLRFIQTASTMYMASSTRMTPAVIRNHGEVMMSLPCWMVCTISLRSTLSAATSGTSASTSPM